MFGQLGDGTVNPKSSPVQVGALNNWLKMSAGHMHTAIIKTDGTLWTTGRGIDGGLGLGDTTDRYTPAQVTGSAWSTVAAGNNCTLATKTDGTLWTWGLNNYGQLGQGDLTARMTPTQIGVGTNWSKVAIGNQHSMAIKTDGTLWSWGDNDVGVLGQNSNAAQILQPGQIGELTTWADVTAGIGFGLATKTDGTLWSWGGNAYGELGYGDRTYTKSPVQVGALTTWSKIDGWEGVVATKIDGTLWSVGKNNHGQLGDGTVIHRSSPVQIGSGTTWLTVSILGADIPAASVISSVEQTDTGKVTVSFITPKLAGITTTWTATSSPGGLTASNTTGLPITVTGLSSGVPYTFTVRGATAEGLAPNSAASSSVTLTPTYIGRLWSWGKNNVGQLGLSTSGIYAHRSSPVQVGAGTTWLEISHGWKHAAAIKTDGTLWSWGYNGDGALGDDGANRSSPVQIGALTNWSKVALSWQGSSAIKTDGTLWSWGGAGWSGSQGLNDTASRNSPTQVGALTNWSKITKGSDHSLARKSDGTLWSWGYNAYGQLGQGDAASRSSPVQVGAGTTWLIHSTGYRSSIAIKTDGTLWSWGVNSVGTIGDGTVINKSSPVQIGALTNWSKVTSGNYHTMATKTDGTLWSWGDNSAGQLGDGTVINKSSPVQIGSGTTWLNTAAASGHTMATKTDGTLWAWGMNYSGEVGDGTVIHRSSPVQVGTLTSWSKVSASLESFSSAISGPVAGVTPTGVTVETIDTTATISYTPGA